MKVLQIEDDQVIATIIRLGLKAARYTVDTAADGPTGLAMALAGDYDLIILDVMLPGMDGWAVCEALRRHRNTTPILMLTARDAAEDRVRGLEIGADDYLPKPFHFPELLVRVRVLARRNQVHRTRLIRVADLELDTLSGRVSRSGQEIPLTPREYSLLEVLAANEGRVLSPEAVARQLAPSGGGEERLTAELAGLMRKLNAGFALQLIYAVGGAGFILRAPETTAPAALSA